VQIVSKNSVESHLWEWKGTCIELSYDVINENYLSFDVNGKRLMYTNLKFNCVPNKFSVLKHSLKLNKDSNITNINLIITMLTSISISYSPRILLLSLFILRLGCFKGGDPCRRKFFQNFFIKRWKSLLNWYKAYLKIYNLRYIHEFFWVKIFQNDGNAAAESRHLKFAPCSLQALNLN